MSILKIRRPNLRIAIPSEESSDEWDVRIACGFNTNMQEWLVKKSLFGYDAILAGPCEIIFTIYVP